MAITRTELVGLYVANFNRAPDQAGFDYWMRDGELGATRSDISRGIFSATGYNAADQTSRNAYVTLLYNNMFNRAPDPDGWAYWTGRLDAGTLLLEDLPFAMYEGAADIPGTDQDDWGTINNKIIAADAALTAGNTSVTTSLATVTSDFNTANAIITASFTTATPSIRGEYSCNPTIPATPDLNFANTTLDVVGKFKDLSAAAIDIDSIYIRAKDTFQELLVNKKINESEYAQLAAGFVSQLAVSATQQAMQTALQWAAEEAKIVYEVAAVKANADLVMAQRERTKAEICKIEKDVALQCANITATIATSIRKNGPVASYDVDGCTPLSLKNEGSEWAQQQLIEANVYTTLADAYRKSGKVTVGIDSDGYIKGITGDDAGYTKAQADFARRQILSFEDSKRSHAANAVSQLIGQLLAQEITPSTEFVQQWNRSLSYLTMNTLDTNNDGLPDLPVDADSDGVPVPYDANDSDPNVQ